MDNKLSTNIITANIINVLGTTEQKQKQAEKYYNLLGKSQEKMNLLSGKIHEFIDADTIKILDEQGNINSYRLNTGIYGAEYDAIDDKETILNNPYKYKTQVPLLEKAFNKSFNDITDEDIQNYKNYQNLNAVSTYGLNLDKTFDTSLPFNPNQQYNFNPEAYKGMEIQYEDLGENVYGRKSGIVYNPFDYKQNTQSLSTNENQNANLDLIKLDKLYNQAQLNKSIKPVKEAEQTLGQYWKDIGRSSLASINRSLYGLYKVAKDNNIPITDLWDWAIEKDVVNDSIGTKDNFKYIYENPELAELTFKLSNNVSTDYIKANEKKINSIMDSFSKGNYLDAIGKGITAVPDILSTSVGDLTVGLVGGGVAGLATKGMTSNLGKYLITRGVANGTMTMSQLGNVMNEFQINNGYEMPVERQLLAFTALSLANSADVLALDKGVNWFFKNTIGKQLAKDSAKFSAQERNTIRKILVTNPIIAGGATIGEGIQENIQGSVEAYFSQNLEDARTFLQIATSDEQLVEGVLGGLVGGSISLTGLTIGDTTNAIRNKLPKIDNSNNINNIQQTEIVEESRPQKTERILSTMNADLELLNNPELTIEELNDIKTRDIELIKEIDNEGIYVGSLIDKTEKLLTKITLKEKMIKGESLTDLMNDKTYNPDGITDPEELLLKLYYYSDKNNKEEQQIIEELAKEANIDTETYKNYDEVDLEAKFGDRGYYTYKKKLKYYNKQLQSESLTSEDKSKLNNEINKIKKDLKGFTFSQYNKLHKIMKATEQLRNNKDMSVATYEQKAYDKNKSNTRKEAFVKREDLENYTSKSKKGIYKIINATIKNLENSYKIMENHTDTDVKQYKDNLRKLRYKLFGNISSIKKQYNKNIKNKEKQINKSKNNKIKQNKTNIVEQNKTNTVKQNEELEEIDVDEKYANENTKQEEPVIDEEKQLLAELDKEEENYVIDSVLDEYFNKTLIRKQAYKYLSDTSLTSEEINKHLNDIDKTRQNKLKSDSNKTLEEKDINIPKEEKVPVETKSEANTAIESKPTTKEVKNTEKELQQTIKEQEKVLKNETKIEEISNNTKPDSIEQQSITIDEKEEIIEQQPSTYIPNEDNNVETLDIKPPKESKENKNIDYDEITEYTEEELELQRNKLYKKDDIEIKLVEVYDSENTIASDITYNINFTVTEKDENSKPIRLNNQYVKLKDEKGNEVKSKYDNYKPYLLKTNNQKSLTRSKKLYEDLISTSNNTAFDLFSNLKRINSKEGLLDSYVTPELLLEQFSNTETKKQINTINNTNIQNKLKNTYTIKSLNDKLENNIKEVKSIIEKIKVSNTKKSLFSMFTIDKNHPEVKKIFKDFTDTINLNTQINDIINRIKTEPALALLFKHIPQTIDNKELKYISKNKLNDLLDINVVMSIDYAVSTLFAIHNNLLTYNNERVENINNKAIKDLIHSKKQVTKTIVEDKLGELVVDILGIIPNKENITENEWRAIKSNLGLYAFNYALQKGYISITKTKLQTTTKTGITKTNYVTFVQNITNQYDKEYLKAKYELFGLGNIVNKKSIYTKPIQNKEVKIGKGYYNQEVSTLQEMAHEQARQTPYYTNIDNINFIIENKELIKKYLGYTNDLNSISLAEVRIEKEGINQTIDRSIQVLEEFVENYDINNPVFFNTFASKNMRFFIDSNTINPQTDKLHRFLFSTIEENELTSFNFDNTDDKLYFAYGLGQAFGISTDKMSDKSLLDLFNKLTKLSSKDIKEKFINKEKLKFKDIELEVGEVSHFLQGIQALEQYEDMITSGKNTATIRLLVENDSTTSGVAIKLLSLSLFKTYRQEMEQVGIFLDKNITINERKENKANLDIYQGVAKDAKKLSTLTNDEIINEYNTTINSLKNSSINNTINIKLIDKNKLLKIYSFFKPLLPEVDNNGQVTKELREIFKSPVMTYFYMVGLQSMITDLSNTLSIKLFSEYAEAKNKKTLTDKEKLIVKNIESFFNSLEVAYVKGIKKSKIKDKSILELLSIYKFDDIILKNYNMSLNELFTSSIGILYGGTIWNALHNKYKALRGSNILIGLVNNISIDLLNNLYNKFDLKNKTIKEVEDFIANVFYPSVAIPYSSNKYQGIIAIDKDTVFNNISEKIYTVLNTDNIYTKILNKEKEFITNKPNNFKTATMGTVIGETEFIGKTTGLPVIMTHAKDGAIINLVMSLFKNLLTVHDATVYQANLGKDIVYNYNKSFYEVVTNYNDYTKTRLSLQEALSVSSINSIELKDIQISKNDYDSIVSLLNVQEIQEFKNNLTNEEQNTLDIVLSKSNNTNMISISPTELNSLLNILSKVVDYQHTNIKANNITISNMDGIQGTQYNNKIQEQTIVEQVKNKTEEYIKENTKIKVNEDGVEEFIVNSKVEKLNPDILKYFDSTIEDDNNVLETRLLTNGEERVNLFEELANKFITKDNPFKEELKELLSNLNSLRLDNLTVDLINSIKEYGEYDITNNKIVLAANESSPVSRYSNSAVRYVHEIIHAVTAFALENSKKLKIDSEKNKLLYLYQLASKHIKPEDFLPEVSINPEEDMKEAIKIWNYVFKNNDPKYPLRGLNEFIAYALTDERIANKLKTIMVQEDKIKKPFREIIKELIKKIFNLILPSDNKSLQREFPNLYNFISGNAGFKNKDVHASILALVQRISVADNKALNYKAGYAEALKGIIEGMKQYVYEPLNTTLSKGIKHIITAGDKTFNINEEVLKTKDRKGTFKTLELLGITAKTIAYSLISSKARNALPSVLSMYGIGSIGETFRGWGTIGRWINEIKGTDELGNVIQKFNRQARQLDIRAMDLTKYYHNIFIDSFKDDNRPNGLNNTEKVALTDVILKTDLQALDLNIKDLKTLLTNDTLIEQELNKQFNIIKKQSRNTNDYNYYKNNITLLAYYMKTSNLNSLTTLTAKEIADKAGTSTRFVANKDLITAITKATSLLALKNTPLKARQLVSSFNSDGLNFYIQSHKSYKEGTSTEINANTYIGRSKGYTKELIDNAHDIRIGLLSDKDKMIKKGFKPITDEIVGSIGDDKLIVYKDGYRYDQHRNGATFMYTGYAKLGTNMYDYIESEKELINKDINVRNKSASIRKTVENDRFHKTRELEKREFSLDELIKLGEKTKGILTVYDEDGNISDYSFIIPRELSKTIGLNEDGFQILAKMNSSLVRQQEAVEFNKKFFEFLTTLQDSLDKGSAINYKTNYRWVAIDNNTPDKFINDTYKSTDKQFKQLLYQYKKNNGFKPLLVREDLVLDIFGQSDISLASKIIRNHYIMKNIVDLAERLMKFVATTFKTLIVIKTPIVLIGNIISNINLHALQGINPIHVIKKYINGFKHLQAYQNDKARVNELLIKKNVLGLNKNEESELDILQTKISQNPIYPLVKNGFLTNIVDDVTIVNYDNTSDFSNKIDKLKSKLPKPLQSVLDITFLTEKTMFFQTMTKATQYSDFLARFVDYDFYMDKAKEKYKGKDLKTIEDRIVSKIMDNYINYDRPHSSLEQYANDMGLLLFTKYFKRIQSVITRFTVDKPVNTLLFLASQLFLINTSDIFESSLLFKDLDTYVYNPISNIEEITTLPIARL